MAIFNLETRAPYWKNMQFVWFLDAGNVFKLAGDIRSRRAARDERLRRSAIDRRSDRCASTGAGSSDTRLVLTGGRERSNVLHISLGQAF